jgi:hypothetical protein
VWFSNVFRHEMTPSFSNMLLLTDYLDASAAAGGRWFHNVHVFEAFNLPFVLPSLVVFREDVSLRANVILCAMLSLHPEHVPP